MLPVRVGRNSCPACSAPVSRHPASRRGLGLSPARTCKAFVQVSENAIGIVTRRLRRRQFFSLLTSTQGVVGNQAEVETGKIASSNACWERMNFCRRLCSSAIADNM